MDRTVDKGAESLSIEETNAIRIKLGLKPLAVPERGDGFEKHQCQPESKATKEDRTELNDARKSLIEGDSIAVMLKKGEDFVPPIIEGAYEKSNDKNDLKAWSRRMALIMASNRISALNYSDDEEEAAPTKPLKPNVPLRREKAKLKVLHQIDDLPLDQEKGVVLTLADVGILEAEASEIADVDFLENPEMPSKVPLKGKQRDNVDGNYSPYEDDGDHMKDGETSILKKYDRAVDEYNGTQLSNLATGKHGFYVSLDEETETTQKRPGTLLTQPTEECISFSGLKRKKDMLKNRQKPVNWNKVFKSTRDDKVDETIDDTECTKIVKTSNLDMDDSEECNHLYKELSKHRNRILATVKPEETRQIGNSNLKTSVIDMGTAKEEKPGLQLNATSEFIYVVKPKILADEPVGSTNKQKEENNKEPAEDEKEQDSIEYQEGNVDNNAPMTMGIAEALSYLKDKGDLIEETKDLSNVGNDINLQYIDEYGRKMTPKEAFRKISWRFHGKGPGMNKQERKIKRLERERLAKQSPLEGLPTIKALLTHQMETKTSHLVLSGNSTLP